MKTRNFFPLGKAYGDSFCNRVEETKRLIDYIEGGKHSFLVAPRRYGKSSLCARVFELVALPHGVVDFHLAVSEKDAERLIIKGVSDLIGKALGPVEKLSHLIKKYAKQLTPKLTIGSQDFHLELSVNSDSNSVDGVVDALFLLEKLLCEKDKQAILLFDEFQEIGEISQGRGIEGAIRHVAQETKNLSFIFSGSIAHLLKSMFEDERRPLYKLCRKLVLDRISQDDYQKHLHKAAKLTWKKELDLKVFERIMDVSERHPYYVNYLCDELWSRESNIPDVLDVERAWNLIVEEERSDLLKDFFTLPDNQRKLLIHVANFGGKDIHSHATSQRMDVPSGSVAQALNDLVEKDFLEKAPEGYRLIVPPYKTLLQKQ
ncbi:MAG: hypothetical protein WCW01_01985 [Gammaproteobacteria bacterium]